MKKKRCRHCKGLFLPDARNQDSQKYCDTSKCRAASKVASRKGWLNKPENQDYFKGPLQVERVREWRKKNPGYWKRAKRRIALQDSLTPQPAETIDDNAQIANSALQDLLTQVRQNLVKNSKKKVVFYFNYLILFDLSCRKSNVVTELLNYLLTNGKSTFIVNPCLSGKQSNPKKEKNISSTSW